MLQFCSLYSGSSGNSFLIKSNNTNILIDSGVSARKIVDGLTSINMSISDIQAILVTHEHIDHTRSLHTLSSKYNLPVYANSKTWSALKDKKDKIAEISAVFFDEDKILNDGQNITYLADILNADVHNAITALTENKFDLEVTDADKMILPLFTCYLQKLYIYPKYRNKGYAKYIFTNLEDIFNHSFNVHIHTFITNSQRIIVPDIEGQSLD
ncbi:MAG: MBL fold metallo-hydrolase, partial [Oscillospiraceae bacterium]|nr:MBL fold metallo-hydrolase [Oscillospiraceae bacterium]